jgi:transcription elongation factor Elf1
MQEQKLEARYGGEIAIDVCRACHGFWFDLKESLQLSPGSVLSLFKLIHECNAHPPVPLHNVMTCPRCGERLMPTTDLIRTTRFTYFRCPRGCGRHSTFFQFLREKSFVRDADPKQLAALREQVKVIHCSNCGAPVELARSAVCEHCHAPVSSLDPAALKATLAELEAAEAKRKNVDPTLPARLMVDQLKVQGFYNNLERDFPSRQSSAFGRRAGIGLVEAGIAALFDALF